MKSISKSKLLSQNLSSNDVIRVESGFKITQVEIISIDGKIIRLFQNSGNDLDVSDLNPGVYMIKCMNGNDNHTRLFIKN